MVAAGPFTTQDGLLYEPLKDLMDLVKRDQPHCLILMGPFLDARNENLLDGDICIETYSDKNVSGPEYEFFDYEDLTKLLMKYIQSEINIAQKQGNIKNPIQVVLIPSAREINHIYPLP